MPLSRKKLITLITTEEALDDVIALLEGARLCDYSCLELDNPAPTPERTWKLEILVPALISMSVMRALRQLHRGGAPYQLFQREVSVLREGTNTSIHPPPPQDDCPCGYPACPG